MLRQSRCEKKFRVLFRLYNHGQSGQTRSERRQRYDGLFLVRSLVCKTFRRRRLHRQRHTNSGLSGIDDGQRQKERIDAGPLSELGQNGDAQSYRYSQRRRGYPLCRRKERRRNLRRGKRGLRMESYGRNLRLRGNNERQRRVLARRQYFLHRFAADRRNARFEYAEESFG